MKIGITGHQVIKNPFDWLKIQSLIEENLKKIESPVIGITSLAKGADQVFAKAILKHSGSLWVVLPFKDYDTVFQDSNLREEYSQLLKKADKVEILELDQERETCYFEAGKRIVDQSDFMIAVWDGKKAAGLGGTGDIVAYAHTVGKKIIHIRTQ